MNNSPTFSTKKKVCILCIALLFLLASITGIAQSEEELKLKELQVYNETIIRNVFIAGIVILMLFTVLLYSRFKLKKKAKKKLAIKKKQISEQSDLNKKLLIEKEWLLKEMHHRVKNNLQIVISLLNTQSAYLENKDALMAIQNSQHRMYAMSLIHQKLYQTDNLSQVDISWYIHELIRYMKESFEIDEKINFVLAIEKMYLDIGQAVPMGLIINEALNNAIKYAFPLDRKGEIFISLKNTESNTYQFIIEDNGVGLPDHFEDTKRSSLGMNLMIGLTDQIDGTFDMKNDNGVKIKITFTKSAEFKGSF